MKLDSVGEMPCLKAFSIKEIKISGAMTVSYTHLDVYKRQAQHHIRALTYDFTNDIFGIR